MTKRIITKVGDILEIPLSDERKSFAQYIFFDKKYGDLVLVFNTILNKKQEVDIDKIKKSKPLFRPVITNVKAAIKYHNWKKIGNFSVDDFVYPRFLSGWPKYWFLWDGERDIKLGESVPEKYHELEYLQGYSPDLIAERILTGIKPEDKMIRTNKHSLKKTDL